MGAKLLENLIFIQGSRCFFCDKHLPQEKASVEHLLATSRGGTNTDENRVACCQTINGIFGNKSLKEKFAIVLRQQGSFCCPEGKQPAVELSPASAVAHYEKVVSWLRKQGKARPASGKTLESSIISLLRGYPQACASDVIKRLQEERKITIKDNRVIYSL